MKKTVLFLALFFSASFAHAQSWLIAGNPCFSASLTDAIDKNGTLYLVYGDGPFGGPATVMKFNGSGVFVASPTRHCVFSAKIGQDIVSSKISILKPIHYKKRS